MRDKQKRFADEYLIDCNATQAAVRAGYSPKRADSTGCRLLGRPDVRTYIDEQLESLSCDKIAEAREVMEYLTAVLRGESRAEIVVIESQGEGRTRARHLDKAPDEKERLKAAELLGKRYGIFTERINLEGYVSIAFLDDLG